METQVGKELSTDKAEKRKKTEDSATEVVADKERPAEAPISHHPVRLEANQEEAYNDDVDEGIDVCIV